MRNKFLCLLLITAAMPLFPLRAGEGTTGHTVPIKYGNMDHWVVRHIKESGVIGGNTKTLYEIGPSRTINGNTAYSNLGGSPWGTSNVMAKVMGVTKTNCSVTRDRHGSGYCAKLETHIETCRVLGLMNINVLAAGSIFLGDMREPITSTKEGPKALNSGIPFTACPRAIRYDYRMRLGGSGNRIKMTGFGSKSTVKGKDYGIAVLLLQHRTEDKHGNITAKRVGTMVALYGSTTNGWVENATYTIQYGDIRHSGHYNAALMGLRSTDYARNSRGKSVPVREVGWASANEKPTHMVLQFSSSHGGAYIGTPGNTLWIDNVEMVY